jgi:hypothetical protein
MTNPATSNGYEKWLWIELIGFDNTKQDFGVTAYLETAGFTPYAVSFLLTNPDFIHDHDGACQNRVLDPTICCYGGYERSEERQRQPWTPAQIKALVAELRQRGIRVLFAVFDSVYEGGWLWRHPELRSMRKDGSRSWSLCPLKRLGDGTYYEDFFAKKLMEVIRDYGFDGLHAADGFAPPRIPIYDGDFSDDMIDQFLMAGKVEPPADLPQTCEDEAG